MLTIKNILLVGLGGMIGTILRYSIVMLLGQNTFPLATFLINIAGSFIIGIIFGITLHTSGGNWVKLFFATGICGGFTTFSAFSIENVELLQQEKYLVAATYITGSIVFGIAAAFAGFWLTKNYY